MAPACKTYTILRCDKRTECGRRDVELSLLDKQHDAARGQPIGAGTQGAIDKKPAKAMLSEADHRGKRDEFPCYSNRRFLWHGRLK